MSHTKKSSHCAFSTCAKRAIKYANGYDSYCREHKRQKCREYMAARRKWEPTYGQGRYR